MMLLVTVAHPDDETFGCGSLLAHARALGAETAVLCATRGEAGETMVPTDDLPTLREGELREAARILDVGEVRLLAYGDSNMTGTPAPGTLCAANPADVAADVRQVLEELRPDVVVTLDGLDGHRDHAAIGVATLAAVDAMAEPPTATYLWCLTRSRMALWVEHMRATEGGEAYVDLPDLGTPDDLVTLEVDTLAYLDLRWTAMRAHASQQNPFDGLPDALQRQMLGVESLRLVRGVDALFA